MSKKPAKTPIERAIDGEPAHNRRKRYDHRMKEAGFRRVSVWVPAEAKELVHELRESLSLGRTYPEIYDDLRAHFGAQYEFIRQHAVDEEDRAWAQERLSALDRETAAHSEDARSIADSVFVVK